MRRAPYFVKIAKGLRLGYYRGATAGTWIGRRYLGQRVVRNRSLGLADDTTEADEVKGPGLLASPRGRQALAERSRLADVGMTRRGPTAFPTLSVTISKRSLLKSLRGQCVMPDILLKNSVLPELGHLLIENLTTDRLVRWRNALAARPLGVRKKRTASIRASRAVADTDEARRKRKATANRSLTMLKAALNRAFHGGRVASDMVWRKVKPFARVESQ